MEVVNNQIDVDIGQSLQFQYREQCIGEAQQNAFLLCCRFADDFYCWFVMFVCDDSCWSKLRFRPNFCMKRTVLWFAIIYY